MQSKIREKLLRFQTCKSYHRLTLICLLNFILNCFMQLYAPIFVNLAFADRGLNQVLIGFVTACFPLGMMVFSFFIETIVVKIGQRYSFLLSMFLAVLAALSYGLVYYIQEVWVFAAVSIIGRIIHGLEDVIFEVICIHYIQHTDDLDKDKSFASYKLAGSAGFIMGGILAPWIFAFLGYFLSFMLYGGLVGFFGVYAFYILPQDSSEASLQTEEDELENNIQDQNTRRQDAENQRLMDVSTTSMGTIDEENALFKSAKMSKILKNRRMLLTLMGLFLSLCCLMTIIPTLTIMLSSRHNITTEASYYFFVVQEIGFLSSQLLPYFFGDRADTNTDQYKQKVIQSSFFVIAIGLILTGPSNLMPISQEYEIPFILVGLFIQGFGVGMLLIMGNLQLLKIAKTEYRNPDRAIINSQCLFVFAQGFGETFGMVIGPLISSEYSFRWQCDFFTIFTIIIGITYIIQFKDRPAPKTPSQLEISNYNRQSINRQNGNFPTLQALDDNNIQAQLQTPNFAAGMNDQIFYQTNPKDSDRQKGNLFMETKSDNNSPHKNDRGQSLLEQVQDNQDDILSQQDNKVISPNKNYDTFK
eukprot:403332156